MILKHLKNAFRSLLRNSSYSFLNIFGLAAGIACSGFIFLWAQDELNFDSSNVKKDHLYIVRANTKLDNGINTISLTPGSLAPALKSDIPGIENTTRLSNEHSKTLFAANGKSIFTSGQYADASLFEMFTLPFVDGNPAMAFSQPNSVVITEKTASKFFGDNKNVVGRTIRVDNKQDYTVSGVLKDLPANSTLQFDWLMPFQQLIAQRPALNAWRLNSTNTFVELKSTANAALINQNISGFIQKQAPQAIARLFLFSMNDWHLYDEFSDGKPTGSGKIAYVHLFTSIAWIILLIASINFMNLATASSDKRAREVGVRKVLGADKFSLIAQFIIESLILAFIAAVIGILFMKLTLPYFNQLVQKELTINLFNPQLLYYLLMVTLICGFAAGLYPSFYLSSFNPVAVLKGLKQNIDKTLLVRKSLVVTQFAVSIVLISCTMIVYQQVQHVKSRQLGFNKNNLIELDVNGLIAPKFDAIRQSLIQTGYVADAALSTTAILGNNRSMSGISWAGKQVGSKVPIEMKGVTPDFTQTSGITLAEGRLFNGADAATQRNVVITKSMEKLMGNGSAIGKTMFQEADTSAKVTVVGVVNDYLYANMYEKPTPVIFLPIPSVASALMYISIKPNADKEKALASIQGVMHTENPAYPFDYRFVDEQFNQLFLTETLVSKLSKAFAALAIVISCLGLFGLTAYNTERRIKEIGIRKILGASGSRLAILLYGDMVTLIAIACLLGFPIAYFEMHGWLNHYAYRISIQPWVFGITGLTTLLIAVLAMGIQLIRAIRANPVESLRSE